MSGEGVCVLVVEDHDVVQWGFRLLLSRQPWIDRVLVARDGDEALELLSVERPDVALVDLFLGSKSGAELCTTLRSKRPEMRVLLISGAGWVSPESAKAAGAAGFVSKSWRADEVVSAVQMVAKGMTVFAPQDEPAAARLSSREREVLSLMASGATNPEIATSLFLSPHTVKEHTRSIYRKLEVRNRTEAVRRAERLGLTR